MAASVGIAWAGHLDGRVGYWRFHEGTAIVASDSSGHSNDGTLIDAKTGNADGNTPPSWSTDTPFTSGLSLDFDGEDDLVKVPHNDAFNGNQDLSISWWKKPAAESELRYDLYKSFNSSDFGDWTVGMDNTTASFQMVSTASGSSVTTCTGTYANNWHHVVATHDFGTGAMRLYVDGVLCGSNTFQGTHRIGSFPLWIGSSGLAGLTLNENYWVKGGIYDVRISDRALSAAEIQEAAAVPGLSQWSLMAMRCCSQVRCTSD